MSFCLQGFKNDLKAAMDQVDEAYLQEILKSGGESDAKTNDVKVKDDGTTIDDILVTVSCFTFRYHLIWAQASKQFS